MANSATTIRPWVYAADVLTKAKRALCDVAQFVADLLGCSSRVHKNLTTVMTRIVVDKGADHAKPYSIWFFATISKLTKTIFVLTTENTDSDLKVRVLHYANELFVRVRFPVQKLLQTRLI